MHDPSSLAPWAPARLLSLALLLSAFAAGWAVGCGGEVPLADSGDQDPTDADGDGYLSDVDCDDSAWAVAPGRSEQCDGLDNDCDGELADFEVDADGDGFLACSDCDDSDPSAFPTGDVELCGDGVDNNCDGELEDTDSARCACVDDPALAVLSLAQRNAFCWAEVASQQGDVQAAQAELVSLMEYWETLGCPTAESSEMRDEDEYAVEETSETTWTADCTDSGGRTVSGTAEQRIESRSSNGPDGSESGHDTTYLSFAAMSATGVRGSPAATTSLAGEVLHDYSLDAHVWDTNSPRSRTRTAACLGLEVATNTPIGGDDLATFALPGVWSADLCLTGWDTWDKLNGPFCDDGSRSFGSMTWTSPVAEWHADINFGWRLRQAEWAYECNFPEPGDSCLLEPFYGGVSVELRDGPGGAVTSTVSVTWDGETDCDGCGVVSLDGAPVATYCL